MEYTELYHHGILGQKWGIRRYQNTDGSLTNAGKKRYSGNSEPHPDYMKAHTKKKVSEMSDEELNKRLNRIRMEQQYNQLSKPNKNKSRGQEAIKKIIEKGKLFNTLVSTALAVWNNLPKVEQLMNEISEKAKASAG